MSDRFGAAQLQMQGPSKASIGHGYSLEEPGSARKQIATHSHLTLVDWPGDIFPTHRATSRLPIRRVCAELVDSEAKSGKIWWMGSIALELWPGVGRQAGRLQLHRIARGT